ncbi:hypothetical protein [Methanosarcina sp.]|uniref:hypothetical protein n=1 Tax=Methanosarcina sp. TaxID=2213 RepID=UPI002BC60C21|nr:hypothetical protein [Methanosarcina sp.]HOW13915.1 hypothetical protein [Methanosarcina sp.]
MLSKYGKLLLGACIMKRLVSGKSHKVSEVSEHKRCRAVSKYGKLILSAYLIEELRTWGYGTREHGERKEGLLSRYGKLMLTTCAVKKLRSGKSHKEEEQPEKNIKPSSNQGSFLPHMVKKYGKWLLGVYLLRKFHHREPEAELEEVEVKTYEEDKGSSMIKFNKVAMGALAGITAAYAIKKYRAKHSEDKTGVE